MKYQFQHSLKKLPCGLAVRFVYRSRNYKVAGSVDTLKETEFTLVRAQLCKNPSLPQEFLKHQILLHEK